MSRSCCEPKTALIILSAIIISMYRESPEMSIFKASSYEWTGCNRYAIIKK